MSSLGRDNGYYSDITADVLSPASASAFDTSDEEQEVNQQRGTRMKGEGEMVEKLGRVGRGRGRGRGRRAASGSGSGGSCSNKDSDSGQDNNNNNVIIMDDEEYAEYEAFLQMRRQQQHQQQQQNNTRSMPLFGTTSASHESTNKYSTSIATTSKKTSVSSKGGMKQKFRKWKVQRSDKYAKKKQEKRLKRLTSLRRRRSNSLERGRNTYSDGDRSAGDVDGEVLAKTVRSKVRDKVKRYFDDRRERRDTKREIQRMKQKRGKNKVINDISKDGGAGVGDGCNQESDNELESEKVHLKNKSKFGHKIKKWVQVRTEKKKSKISLKKTNSNSNANTAVYDEEELGGAEDGGEDGSIMSSSQNLCAPAMTVDSFDSPLIGGRNGRHTRSTSNGDSSSSTTENNSKNVKKSKGLARAKEKWKQWRLEKKEKQQNKGHDVISTTTTTTTTSTSQYESQEKEAQQDGETKEISIEKNNKVSLRLSGALTNFFRRSNHDNKKSPRTKLLEDHELSRPANILNVLPMDYRLNTIVDLWSYTRPKQREKTLRFSGNQAVSTIEEQLCSVHRRALNALIKSREPSDILRGYDVQKMGRSRRIKNRVKKLNKLSKKKRNQMKKDISTNMKKIKNKLFRKSGDLDEQQEGDAEEDEEEEYGGGGGGDDGEEQDDDNQLFPRGGYFSLGKWIGRERLLRLVLLATKPPTIHISGTCSACIVSSHKGSTTHLNELKLMSNEKLASSCSDIISSLLLSYVDRRIGLQILHKLSIPLEVELYNYNIRNPNNNNVIKILNEIPRKYIKKRKKNLKRYNKYNNTSNTTATTNYTTGMNSDDEDEDDINISEEHECAICVDLLCNPIVLSCGHTFCRLCLMKVANTRIIKYLTPLCPLCRDPFTLNDITIDDGLTQELKQIYNKGNGEDMYNERVDESYDKENIIANELNLMMIDRNIHNDQIKEIHTKEVKTNGDQKNGDGARRLSVDGNNDGNDNISGNSGNYSDGNESDGSNRNGTSNSFFSTFEWCIILIIPLMTFIGHNTITMNILRCICILISALTTSLLQYFLFDDDVGGGDNASKDVQSRRRGVIFLLLCFQWACVIAEVKRMSS